MSHKPIDVITTKKEKQESKQVSVLMQGGGDKVMRLWIDNLANKIVRKCQLNAFSLGNHMACNLEQILIELYERSQFNSLFRRFARIMLEI